MSGSWKPVRVTSKSSSLRKYKNEMVIVMSKGKSRKMYLTTKVLDELGFPETVAFFERGSNIAIANADVIENKAGLDCLKVTPVEGVDYYKIVAATGLAKNRELRPGVYRVHLESGMAVFDTASEPSLP